MIAERCRLFIEWSGKNCMNMLIQTDMEKKQRREIHKGMGSGGCSAQRGVQIPFSIQALLHGDNIRH